MVHKDFLNRIWTNDSHVSLKFWSTPLSVHSSLLHALISYLVSQRRQDDNKNKHLAILRGGGIGAERKIAQNAVILGKRHANEIMKVQVLLSRNLVVMTQAPTFIGLETEGLFGLPGEGRITSTVLWNLRLVISAGRIHHVMRCFSAQKCLKKTQAIVTNMTSWSLENKHF